MFDKCLLHIGTEKTGSTSIQEFMRLNRNALQERGFLYPETLGPLNHRRLRNYAASRHEHLTGAEVREHPGGVGGFRSEVARDFQQEIKATNCSFLVVSDEHFHSALTSCDEIHRLRAFLDDSCRQYQVIIYLRRQDELSRSFHSEYIKVGNHDNRPLFPQALSYYYDYRSLIENYASVFGTGNIKVRRFEAASLVNGDVVDDFAAVIGLDDVASWPRSGRKNVSLNGLALQFLAEFNKHVPRVIDDRPNPERAELRSLLETHYAGDGWPASRQQAVEFYRMFSDINEWVRRRFFPNDTSLFDEDFSRYPEHSLDKTPDFNDAVSVAAVLWQHQAKALRAAQFEAAELRASIASKERQIRQLETKRDGAM